VLVRFRRFKAEYRWFQIAGSPVHAEQASIVRWDGINTEVNDLKWITHAIPIGISVSRLMARHCR